MSEDKYVITWNLISCRHNLLKQLKSCQFSIKLKIEFLTACQMSNSAYLMSKVHDINRITNI